MSMKLLFWAFSKTSFNINSLHIYLISSSSVSARKDTIGASVWNFFKKILIFAAISSKNWNLVVISWSLNLLNRMIAFVCFWITSTWMFGFPQCWTKIYYCYNFCYCYCCKPDALGFLATSWFSTQRVAQNNNG